MMRRSSGSAVSRIWAAASITVFICSTVKTDAILGMIEQSPFWDWRPVEVAVPWPFCFSFPLALFARWKRLIEVEIGFAVDIGVRLQFSGLVGTRDGIGLDAQMASEIGLI